MEVNDCWTRFQETGDPLVYLDYVNAREKDDNQED